METYSVSGECGNCGHKCTVEIAKGVLISQAKSPCPNCGCDTLQLQRPSPPTNPWDKYRKYPVVEPWIKKISGDGGPYRATMECIL